MNATELVKKYPDVLVGSHATIIRIIDAALLDAMKEGMRRAADKAIHTGIYASYHPGCKIAAEAIITAAEQLNEKEL